MPVTDELDGQKFFTMVNAKRAATPLFAALVVVELTDVIFAVDSVPAILAVSNEPFLVFASNAFAIMGLRAMYFLLASAKEKFHFLSHALGIILIYVGIKMTISHWYHIDTLISLAVIVGLLALAIWASLKFPKVFGGDEADAHARTTTELWPRAARGSDEGLVDACQATDRVQPSCAPPGARQSMSEQVPFVGNRTATTESGAPPAIWPAEHLRVIPDARFVRVRPKRLPKWH